MRRSVANMRRENRIGRWMAATACVVCCVVSSCSAKDPCLSDDPRDVVKRYLVMLDAQNEEGAYACLSSEAQKSLADRAEAFNADHPDGKRTPGEMLRAGHVVASTREYKKFEVQTEDRTKAVVDIVMQDGRKIPVALRREAERWSIELDISREKVPGDSLAEPRGDEHTQTDKK